jgi:hypothetical protein
MSRGVTACPPQNWAPIHTPPHLVDLARRSGYDGRPAVGQSPVWPRPEGKWRLGRAVAGQRDQAAGDHHDVVDQRVVENIRGVCGNNRLAAADDLHGEVMEQQDRHGQDHDQAEGQVQVLSFFASSLGHSAIRPDRFATPRGLSIVAAEFSARSSRFVRR